LNPNAIIIYDMKIFASSDLHVDFPKNISVFELPRILDSTLKREKDDCAFVIVGDIAQNLPLLHNFLMKFKHIPVPKFVTSGNHDLWVEATGPNSFMKYTLLLKEAVEDAGFHYLDSSPAILGDIGIIGNIGWYDYSFRRRYLNIPSNYQLLRVEERKYINWEDLTIEDYQKKVLYGEIDDKLHLITRWNDLMYVRWNLTDEEFSRFCFEKIKCDYECIRNQVKKILFCSHHIHFQQCVHYRGTAKWDFNTAFYGSESIGNYLLSESKTVAAIFAHSHCPDARLVENRMMTYNLPFKADRPSLHSIVI
jgi:predicted phosphohydrolase